MRIPGRAVRRASRRVRVASKLTSMPRGKLASAPEDMMPWNLLEVVNFKPCFFVGEDFKKVAC